MNTNQFAIGHEFDLLDLKARCAFKTAQSISFDLGRWSDTLRVPRADGAGESVRKYDRPCVWHGGGWIDVHHSCGGPFKTQLRVCAPDEYRSYETMKRIAYAVLAALDLPPDESCRVTHFSPEGTGGMELGEPCSF